MGTQFCISFLKVSAWFRSTFLWVLKFLQIKEGGPNFWGEPILQKVRIIWSPLLYFNFTSFMHPNSYSFIRFQCILHDSELKKSDLLGSPFCISILKVSAWFRSTFLWVFKFLQIKERGPNFWGEPLLQKVRIIWSSSSGFQF